MAGIMAAAEATAAAVITEPAVIAAAATAPLAAMGAMRVDMPAPTGPTTDQPG